jgi:transposase InsO family protein
VQQAFGEGVVSIPSRTTALKILDEISRGNGAFQGATKQKRSIANRPTGTYGRLVATRPGEYLMMDTTVLDVFGLDRLTNRWTRCELTVAMDVYSRCITAVRLTPVSTKAIDAALLLYEAITSDSTGPNFKSDLPYLGVPSVVVVDAPTDERMRRGLPGVAVETMVVDHGKIYLSDHLFAVCDRLGISVQPARKHTPTDKGPIERWFRTLGEGLLGTLPGYKGPDVYSRGESIEQEAFYTIDQLEQIVREWIVDVYHRRIHKGLTLPQAPGVDLSPIEAYKQGVARTGMLRIPQSPNLALDFLPVEWRTIQHYGVDIKGLRFNADCLDQYRSAKSPYGGPNAGKWPFRFDPDDLSTLHFQDPQSNEWNEVPWVRRDELGLPFSEEALIYAREVSRNDDLPFDEVAALSNLLNRWDAGLHQNVAERRMAIRADIKRQPLNESRFQVVDDRTPVAVERALNPLGHDELAEGDVSDDDYLDEPPEDFYDGALEIMR